MKKYIILFLTTALFASCNDWLDVTPKDKQLEDDLFATEFGIQNATNGLYREIIGEALYGGRLSQTTVEVMGHVYTYPTGEPSSDANLQRFYSLGTFNYRNDAVKGDFSNIWGSAYTMLLHINIYIKNLKESSATISEKNRNILLGEVYGLRAYLHFDLFRLFGPAWQDRTNNKILPYNNKPTVTLNHTGYEETEYSTAEEFMQLVWDDITEAEKLLKDTDPIIDDKESITKDPSSDFYRNRNRRMNYYAVKGLEARVHQYCGAFPQAAEAAKVVTDQVGSDQRFNWVTISQMTRYYNYIFFSEVVFGINNLSMSSQANTRYEGATQESSYAVDANHLMQNVLGYGDGTSLAAVNDIRSKQWIAADNIVNLSPYYPSANMYKSIRYNTIPTNAEIQAVRDLQVLIRISEMYYIQAEANLKAGRKAEAIQLLNEIAVQRRAVPAEYNLPADATEAVVQAYIEREYYREFFGEGQVFFYHKRLGSTSMFKGNGKGTVTVSDPKTAYVVPIPETETDI